MPFPEDWPEGCPPGDAIPATGPVYRVVKQNPAVASDFESHKESGRLPDANPCLRCGLSVFRKKEEAIHMRRLFRRMGDYVAEANLAADHGVTKLTEGTQPTHTTWWPFDGMDRAGLFVVVEEIR